MRYLAVLLLLLLPACTSTARSPQDEAALLLLRDQHEDAYLEEARHHAAQTLATVKLQYDEFLAGKRLKPPVVDYLIITGGGDFGAFGAGVLKGWSKIPKTDNAAMPPFDIVTGVSTGALIAPFAFLGTDDALDRVLHIYRNPDPDWVVQRWPLAFLPDNISFAEVPGLERELKKNFDMDIAKKIADTGHGRMLAVNTTNLDDGTPRVFELVPECQRAVRENNLSRLYDILLASSGIPAVFPYREIDGAMYVDGGVTANMIYGGRLSEEDSLPALWQAKYPTLPIPKIRYWILFNNQLRPPPKLVKARWMDIVTRSIDTAVRHATRTAIRHLFAIAEIARLKRRADIEIRLIAIPDTWHPPVEGAFKKETMNNLADLGEKMGADPASWNSDPLAP